MLLGRLKNLATFFVFSFLFTFPVLGQGGHHHVGGPKEGDYLGYLKVDGQKFKIPVSLNLVILEGGEEYIKLHGFLKILLGGFGSNEYYVQFFDHIVGSMKTGEVVFQDEEKEINISGGMAHEMMGGFMIMGKFRSANGQVSGRIQMFHDTPDVDIDELVTKIFSSAPVVKPLRGSYLGVCDGIASKLQLETVKWGLDDDDDELEDNPLLGYKILGRWGEFSPPSFYYNTARFSQGSYNFYTGELSLPGMPKSIEGKVLGNSITVGDCTLTKDAEPSRLSVDQPTNRKKYKRQFHVEFPSEELVPTRPTPKDLSGEYYGYVHHEGLDRYQYLRLNVKAYMFQPIPHQEYLYVSAVSWLHFGGPKSKEFKVSQFKQREYKPTAPQFLFEGMGDTMIQVNSWLKGAIKGTLYSKSFSRVGTIELLRNKIPPLPESAKRIEKLSGTYSGPGWQVKLKVTPNTVSSDHEFFPLRMRGTAIIPKLGRTYRVSEGKYDFYTDSLSFKLEDDRVVTGIRTDSADLNLFWPGKPAWNIRLGEHTFGLYKAGE